MRNVMKSLTAALRSQTGVKQKCAIEYAIRKVNWKTKGLELHEANEILVYVRDIERLKEEEKQRIEKCINFMILSQGTYPNK